VLVLSLLARGVAEPGAPGSGVPSWP